MHARAAVAYDPTGPVALELAVHDDNGRPTGDMVIIDHPGEKVMGPHFAPVCLVDDALGCWPRYDDLMESSVGP